MKKKLSFLLTAAAVLVCADIIKNPDANTLWKEDNKNVEKNELILFLLAKRRYMCYYIKVGIMFVSYIPA